MKEAAHLGLGRQVSVLQTHTAIISNLCWQCWSRDCWRKPSLRLVVEDLGGTWGLLYPVPTLSLGKVMQVKQEPVLNCSVQAILFKHEH